jgi:hypothetical protein
MAKSRKGAFVGLPNRDYRPFLGPIGPRLCKMPYTNFGALRHCEVRAGAKVCIEPHPGRARCFRRRMLYSRVLRARTIRVNLGAFFLGVWGGPKRRATLQEDGGRAQPAAL